MISAFSALKQWAEIKNSFHSTGFEKENPREKHSKE
jgi:hypothetical protein